MNVGPQVSLCQMACFSLSVFEMTLTIVYKCNAGVSVSVRVRVYANMCHFSGVMFLCVFGNRIPLKEGVYLQPERH